VGMGNENTLSNHSQHPNSPEPSAQNQKIAPFLHFEKSKNSNKNGDKIKRVKEKKKK